MSNLYPSVHVLGSRQFGGADQFFVRLVMALHGVGQPVTAITRPASPVAEALVGSGVEQLNLPLANGWDLWSAWRIRQSIARYRPAIVQTYMGRATRLTRLPRTTQSVHIARLGGYYKIDGYYRHAHAWIGNTRGICDYLVQGGLPADKVFHIGNFVPEPQPFSPEQRAELRRCWELPEDASVLLALGRLIEAKGFDDLLRAVARLPAEIGGRPWIVAIAGDGPEAGALRALAKALDVEPRVRWLGWQNPADRCYAAADALVCPSRREPLGNVILEAWNYGLPVVSTRGPGPLELIEPEVNGLLCEPRDAADLAAAIERLLRAPEPQRRAMGAAGLAYLNAHFSQAAILDAYLELYGRLTGA
ncbi:MAG: glycosyltransferase [Methylococcaceae bacterium]|nr:glycosyltransferase [Methylococcaceae bacterium]